MSFLEILYSNWFNRWGISFVIFVLTLILSLILAIFNRKSKSVFTANKTLFAGTFFSAFAYCLPIYFIKLSTLQAVFASFHHALRFFALDGDFIETIAKFEKFPSEIREFYISYGAFLYAFAPLLTFTFILSFFKNLLSHLKYALCFWAHTHVFSELNEKTLALATDISKNQKPFLFFIPRCLVVFTDVIDKKEELSLELVGNARRIGALLFRKDLESIHFKRKNSPRKLSFYLISDDESEKIHHTERIIKHYDYKKTELRVFSDDIRLELLLSANETENIKVIRVNDIQSLIYHNLYTNGINLFKRAREDKDGKKIISAVIVGLGKYGKEMLKALTWYCQMTDYKLKINVFDADKNADIKFAALCPELMSPEYNRVLKEGEPYYDITVHPGVDVAVPGFEEEIRKISDATYFFVSLGNDETNLNVSTKIRAISERVSYTGDGHKPDIETIIFDSNIRKAMGISWEDVNNSEGAKPKGVVNYKSQPYNILMTGDLEHFYSEETVINSKLVDAGFNVHATYSTELNKFSFAQDLMDEEWKLFINENKLDKEWEKHLNSFNEYHKKEIEETNKSFTLSKTNNGFSFITAQEEESLSKANTKEEKEAIKDKVAQRIDKWEKAVYSKFAELTKDKRMLKKWKRIEKRELEKAEKTFRFEYNYRSSIAKAMHKELRLYPEFKDQLSVKSWEHLTPQEKVTVGKIEHVRWNAYMRTEGYSFSEKRNDLAKVHHNLVPVSDLTNDDLRKDA